MRRRGQRRVESTRRPVLRMYMPAPHVQPGCTMKCRVRSVAKDHRADIEVEARAGVVTEDPCSRSMARGSCRAVLNSGRGHRTQARAAPAGVPASSHRRHAAATRRRPCISRWAASSRTAERAVNRLVVRIVLDDGRTVGRVETADAEVKRRLQRPPPQVSLYERRLTGNPLPLLNPAFEGDVQARGELKALRPRRR